MPLLSRSLRYLTGAAVALIATLAAMVAVPASAFAFAPIQPTERVYSVGGTSISIAVFPQAYSGDTLTSLSVTAEPGDLVQTVNNPPAGQETVVTFGDLATDTLYTFTATSTDADGPSPASAPLTTKTGSHEPGQPTDVVANSGDTEIDVSWTAPTEDGGMPVTGYQVVAHSESGAGDVMHTVGADPTSYTITGLNEQDFYDITVRALNVNGPSAASDPVYGVWPRVQVPTDVAVMGGVKSVAVSWTSPAHSTETVLCLMTNKFPAPNSACTGGQRAVSTNGTYTFTGVTGPYTRSVTVWAEGDNGGESQDAYLTIGGSSLTAPKSATVTYGKTLTVSTTRTVDGSDDPGSVILMAKPAGASSFSSLAEAQLVNDKASLTLPKPTKNTTYKWRYNGDVNLIGSESALFTVKVAPVATDALSATSTKVGRTVYLWGSVKPTDAGATVVLQHLVGRTWKSTTTKVKIVKQKMPNGSTIVGFKLPIKATAKGSFSYRADVLANSTYAAAYGPTKVLKVS